MEANLAVDGSRHQPPPRFPYANWGPGMALAGVFLAIGTGILLGIPALIVDGPDAEGDLSSGASAIVQLGTALGFALVPLAIACRGGVAVPEALRRLGLRRFRPGSAALWVLVTIFGYLTFAALYTALVGEPEQEDIAESFGAVPVQIVLIVFAASISEEICFRGMLYGGLRERLPRLPAALLAGAVFGGLHAVTGISAVPPLIAFGFALCLLYEKTGSIVPGILLHMLNNSLALAAQ